MDTDKKGLHLPYLVVAHNHLSPIDLASHRGLTVARNNEVAFHTSVLFFGRFPLALSHGFAGADDGRTGGYGGQDTQNHFSSGAEIGSTGVASEILVV